MGSSRFNPEVPPKVGALVRINTGQFEGYTGEITRLDVQGRVVYFTMTVLERPVELSLSYDTAAEILGVVSASIVEQKVTLPGPLFFPRGKRLLIGAIVSLVLSNLAGASVAEVGTGRLGGKYDDPSGFAFTYPAGWIPITHAAMRDGKLALTNETMEWVAKNKLDLNRIAVYLIRDGRDEFPENLNVVVDDQQVPVDEPTVNKLLGALAQKYAAIGVKLDDLRGSVQKVGSHDAMAFEYQARMPGMPHGLRQMQVLFPGGGKTCIVTCSSKSESFATSRPIFERILASFQTPAAEMPTEEAPKWRTIDWDRVANTSVLGGIASGVLAGLVWVVTRGRSKCVRK